MLISLMEGILSKYIHIYNHHVYILNILQFVSYTEAENNSENVKKNQRMKQNQKFLLSWCFHSNGSESHN